MSPTYHVLLIGIDRYPFGYRGLRGCVNDIDAVEHLLLDAPGVGVDPAQIQVTRLAAPNDGAASTSRFLAATQLPTRENVIAALQSLASPHVQPDDRVLIFYAGHGDHARWRNSDVWHEMLVPHDDVDIQPIFDVEVNALIGAIAERTTDLTVVLDCCHSAGATRALEDDQEDEGVRSLGGSVRTFNAPDLGAMGLDDSAGRQVGSQGLLQTGGAGYLVAVACQADETAKEGAPPDGVRHGVFTQSLLTVLAGLDAGQRSRLRWGDIWNGLLGQAGTLNQRYKQQPQHPWLIGENARRIFGGAWEPMDLGLPIIREEDGRYRVEAGTLAGVTPQAELAVYGPEPLRFAPLGADTDRPIGRLRVMEASPSQSHAEAIGAPFALPLGARARMVKPGAGQRLRVAVQPAGTSHPAIDSPLLALVGADEASDAAIIAQPDGRWVIANDVEPVLAVVPAGELEALRAGLESYYRYQTVLRLARNSNDPDLAGMLTLRLLDCNDQAALAAMTTAQLADPQLPEAPRDERSGYALPQGYRFCIHIHNRSKLRLQVAILDCTSGGAVDQLSDAVLRPEASHVLWLDGRPGVPMGAFADKMPMLDPAAAPPPFVVDRLVAVATTRPDADLRHYIVPVKVQEVVDANLSTMRELEDERGGRPEPEASGPAERWTAAIVPVRILRV